MTELQKTDDETEMEKFTEATEKALLENDLSNLTPDERIEYYRKTCESLGLNPLTNPFKYVEIKGELKLYAGKAGANQLRDINNISIEIIDRTRSGKLYTVEAEATTPAGRIDRDIGVVPITGTMSLEDKANAMMKAETKAKRRVTLSICGLGLPDQTELDTIQTTERPDKNAELPGADEEKTTTRDLNKAIQDRSTEPPNETPQQQSETGNSDKTGDSPDVGRPNQEEYGFDGDTLGDYIEFLAEVSQFSEKSMRKSLVSFFDDRADAGIEDMTDLSEDQVSWILDNPRRCEVGIRKRQVDMLSGKPADNAQERLDELEGE